MHEEPHTSLLGSARRDLGRLHTLSATVARHGFGELLLKTPLGRRLHARRQGGDDGPAIQGSAAVRFTRMLASLGPTFIKLGQILSMRQDLFSKEWIEALQTLQDRAPVVPFERIRESVEEALGMPLAEAFASFDEQPLATASIAQTHLATTHEGERVVVKVQRQGIDEIMRGDLNLLYLGAQVLEASIDEMQLIGVTDIVAEFEKGLLRELDFREELSNLLRMRSLLDPKGSVSVPRPYPELSARSVLTMQFFAGKPLRSLEPESALAHHAVEQLLHATCKQVFVDGFFHGDPHAGNILCDAEGTLCMIDLGLVGTLSEEQRGDVVALMLATFANDSASTARLLLKMGTPTQRVNLTELKAEVERIRSKYLAQKAVGDLDSSGFVQEFAQAAQQFRIKLASEYAILIKSIATLEGIVRNLHPTVDMVSIARPYVQQTLARRLSPQLLMREFASEAGLLGSLAQRLPGQVDQLLHDFETGNLQVRAMTPELDALPLTLHQAASRLSLSLFATAMALCSALLLPGGLDDVPRLVLSIALGLASATAWLILLGWHFVRGRPLRITPLLRLFRRG
jgi:ubiquinone biosynthesis protein